MDVYDSKSKENNSAKSNNEKPKRRQGLTVSKLIMN